jgi:hypothetical protein
VLGAQPPNGVGEYWHVGRVIYETGHVCVAEKACDGERKLSETKRKQNIAANGARAETAARHALRVESERDAGGGCGDHDASVSFCGTCGRNGASCGS